jgi:rRNA maturation protein Rpf1
MKVFHKVYIFQPASSGASVKNNVFDKLRANLQQLTIEDLNQIIMTFRHSQKDYNKCILDDQGSYLKNKKLQRLFKNLCFNRRHLGVFIYLLTKLILASQELHKIFNNLFIFKTSKMELQTIFEEQVDKSYMYLLLVSCSFDTLYMLSLRTLLAKHYITALIG